MNLQRLVEIEVLRLGSRPGTLGINDTIESRLSCISLLYRLGHIDDATHLALSVDCIKDFDNQEARGD